MSRRGFTLLELMLAMLVGSMVVLAATGMFFFFSRSDRAHQLRFEEMNSLSRVHLVMDRALTTLVLSSESRPAPAADTSEGRIVRSIPTQNAQGGTPKDAKSAAPVPARIILGPSPALHRAEPASTSARPLPGDARSMEQPQRLELVVLRSPVPQDAPTAIDASRAMSPTKGSSRGDAKDSGSDAPEEGHRDAIGADSEAQGDAMDEVPGEVGEQDTVVQAYRGAFELRPMDPPHVVRGDATTDPRIAWELWWIPLPPRGDLGEGESPASFSPMPDVPAGRPYLIAKRLAFVQWRAFDDRARRTQYSATRWDDLPAYVELEVETISGIKANWLFEVMGISGGEVATRTAEGDPQAPDANPETPSGATPRPAGSTTGKPGTTPSVTPGKPAQRVKGAE